VFIDGVKAAARESVTAVRTATSQYAVYIADGSGKVFESTGSYPSFSAWHQMPGQLAGSGAPIAAVNTFPEANLNGTINVFIVNPSGQIYTASRRVTGGTWTNWTLVPGLIARAGTGVTAINFVDQIRLFAQDVNGRVMVTTGGVPLHPWTAWNSVSDGTAGAGNTISAAPITFSSKAQTEVWITDPNGGTYTSYGEL
jgi:hypothetical protein